MSRAVSSSFSQSIRFRFPTNSKHSGVRGMSEDSRCLRLRLLGCSDVLKVVQVPVKSVFKRLEDGVAVRFVHPSYVSVRDGKESIS